MLKITPSKEIKGQVALAPNPDLFALTLATAACLRVPVTVSPVERTPLIDSLIEPFAGVADCRFTGDTCSIAIRDGAPADVITLPVSYPFRDFVFFMLLASGRKIHCLSPGEKRKDAWVAAARRMHCRLDAAASENGTLLSLCPDPEFLPPSAMVGPDDHPAIIGAALGFKRALTFETDAVFVNPMRHLLPLFGFGLTVKSAQPDRVRDPIARRIQRMTGKKEAAGTQSFTVSFDFTVPCSAQVAVTLPGDDVLGALLIAAKGIIQKGSLVIDNLPLEPWNTQMLQYVRRMGCTPGIQETGDTSFGACGMVQMQRFDPAGRRIDCLPVCQYERQLAPMVALALFAEGETVLRGMEELRFDDPDMLAMHMRCLSLINAHTGEMPDGIVLKGAKQYDGFDLPQDLPAPVAAAYAVAGMKCIGGATVGDGQIVRRWPRFAELIQSISEFRT